MSIKIEVHGIESSGTCSLSGKEGEVLVLTFGDGTITEAPLSHKAFLQLVRMKLAQKPKAKPEARPEVKADARPVPAAVAVPAGGAPTK